MREPDQAGRGIRGCPHPRLHRRSAGLAEPSVSELAVGSVLCCTSAALRGQTSCLLLGSGGWRPLRARLVGRGRAGGEWAWRVVLRKHHPVRLDHGEGRVCGGQTHRQRAGPFLCEVWWGCRGCPPRFLLRRGNSGTAGRAGKTNEAHSGRGAELRGCRDKIRQGERTLAARVLLARAGRPAEGKACLIEGLLLARPVLVPCNRECFLSALECGHPCAAGWADRQPPHLMHRPHSPRPPAVTWFYG